jgi:hypothetical protein
LDAQCFGVVERDLEHDVEALADQVVEQPDADG